MIRFLLFLLALILAVWIGIYVKADPGYILLAYGHWTIEMPLWLGIIIGCIIFIIISWVIHILQFSGSISGRIRLWSKRKRLHQSHYYTQRGLIDVAEGYWRRAEKNLIKGAQISNTPLINYLAAAKAAQEQSAYDRRDNYLQKAHHANPDAQIAVGLTQAQLQMQHQQYEQALATLRHLLDIAPQHSYVLKLLTKLYQDLNDWESLTQLIPLLRKHHIFPEEKLIVLEVKIYHHLLAKNEKKSISADKFWQTTPKAVKNNPEIITLYCQDLISSNKIQEAEKIILSSMKKNYSSELAKLYGSFTTEEPTKQLMTAESWLKYHKHDPMLLLSLGRLCKANQLWGKARSYLEASIHIKPSQEAYTELGQLLEQLQETFSALECYRKAILLSETSREDE